jgi:hypothetical protein
MLVFWFKNMRGAMEVEGKSDTPERVFSIP